MGQEDSAGEVPLAQLPVAGDGGDATGDGHGRPLHVPGGGLRPLPTGRRYTGQARPLLRW